MNINRREFLQAMALLPLGLAINPLPLKANTTPLQFTTRKGQSYCVWITSKHAATLSPFLLDKTIPYDRVLEIVKKDGMKFLMNAPQFPNEHRVHLRDKEVLYRVIEKRDLVKTFRNMFPGTLLGDINTDISVYWALKDELQKIQPDENNFTEEYAQQLVGYLMKVPLNRIRSDINEQIVQMRRNGERLKTQKTL